nr:hypothetical protein [Tanacetum cinerariifolium]
MSSASSAVTYTSVYTDSKPDEHILLAEEKPLPPVVSPIVESPRYVEDPEEYKDDETEDGPVYYPMDGGDNGDDNDDDSSEDDADDKDEDEEEEDHLASADFTVVIPTNELVFLPEGTEPVIPPPYTDTATTGARITIRLQAIISLPPEAENSLNDSPRISETSSQSPPHINHCCYECGDLLDGIFCKRCTCKSCGKDAQIGYNCPPTVSVNSNLKPCNNQTIDELPQTLPSFHPTFHSEAESPFTLDSTLTYVDESPNVFTPPP